MSHALKRLRELFGDDLFRRTSQGMIPTARALQLAGPITAGLTSVRGALDERSRFDPITSTRRFVVGVPDLGSFALMPLLMPVLRKEAPGVDLMIVDLDPKEAVRKLRLGEIDMAINAFPDLPRDLVCLPISSVEMVCVLDRRNPMLKDGMLDLQGFLDLPHVVVGQFDEPRHPAEFELGTLGLSRRIALRLPHFLAIPGAVVGTDLIAIFDSYTARAFAGWEDLAVVPVPLPGATIVVSAVWHPHSNADAAHRWFRKIMARIHPRDVAGTLLHERQTGGTRPIALIR